MELKRELTKKDLKAFIDDGFDRCPKCKSYEYLSWDSLDAEGEYVWQNFRCSKCSMDGSVLYKVERIEITLVKKYHESNKTSKLESKLRKLEIWPDDLKPEVEKYYKDFYKGEPPNGPIAILELLEGEDKEKNGKGN